ncbi:MAG: hypothetical protein AAF943_08925 [Pseudomonadota bacterium]
MAEKTLLTPAIVTLEAQWLACDPDPLGLLIRHLVPAAETWGFCTRLFEALAEAGAASVDLRDGVLESSNEGGATRTPPVHPLYTGWVYFWRGGIGGLVG